MKGKPTDCFHLTVEIVLEIHAEAIAEFGGCDGVRDMALLECCEVRYVLVMATESI